MAQPGKSMLLGCLLASLYPGRASAQTLVATDETMGTQIIEITGWDMSASTQWSTYPAPAFSCGKVASVSVTAQTDIGSNGRPDIFGFAKLSRLVDNGNSPEKGGSSEVLCYTDNPSWMEITLNFGSPSIFRYPLYSFTSATARRGWIKIEYWK